MIVSAGNITRLSAQLLFFALFLSVPAGAATDAWEFSRAVEKTGTEPAAVPLDARVFHSAQESLADLRLIDSASAERGFAVLKQAASSEKDLLPANVIKSEILWKETVFVIDLGDAGAQGFNALSISTRQENFLRKMDIEGSNDMSAWGPIRRGIVIYSISSDSKVHLVDFSEEDTFFSGGSAGRRAKNLDVSFPPTAARYVRVRIPHGEDREPVKLESLQIFRQGEKEPRESVYPGKILSTDSLPDKKAVQHVVDLGFKNLPVSSVHFGVNQKNFYREVQVEVSGDRKEWLSAGSGAIFSLPAGVVAKERGESASVSFWGEKKARYLRITVINGDNPSIPFEKIEARGLTRFVAFVPEKGRTYSLIYGNKAAAAKDYDAVRYFSSRSVDTLSPATLGPQIRNPSFKLDVRREPWTNNTALLWIVIGAVSIGIIYLAINLIKKL